MLLELRNQLALADDNPGLRPAKQLVAGKADQADACGNHLLRHRLFGQLIKAQIHQRAAAEIGNHRNIQFAANRRQLALFNRFGEAFNMIIAGVNLHQQGGIFIHRRAIIFRMGAVGSAHLMQRAARLAHHVRNTKRPANLHQLAAGNHHLFAAGGGRQHQQHRCGVVIHNAGIFRAGQLAQQVRQRPVTMPASGAVQIVLQRYGRPHGLYNRSHRFFRLLRASQVGMEHGTGQVNHRA
ncbi:Uncharacterised protein [Enterobacter asburiae]|nr:Uncharacterised protein [Enterobacter asburiae]